MDGFKIQVHLVRKMADMQIVPASKNVEAQYVVMMVPLYSYGCERKVKKALSHLKGIYSVNVDFNQQKVTVWGICNKYDVLETTRSKRKDARFWNSEDNIINNFVENNHEIMENPKASPPNKSNPPRDYEYSISKPSKVLMKARSFSFKAWKKVFTRSNSF